MNKKILYANYIASLAQKAILYEVSTTPKPGLVDRNDSGSHKDMDFFTFISSSCSLYKGFYDCAMAGILFEETDYEKLLDTIRPIGIECEKAMFHATEGVNTHKGIIFSLGILCSLVGNLYSKFNITTFSAQNVCEMASKMTKNIIVKDFNEIKNKTKLTHGEFLYKEYGFKGIRGEVESGFKTVISYGLPIMKSWNINQNLEKNELFLEILLNLMAYSEDTNVVSRAGIEGLQYVQNTSKNFLINGGIKQKYAHEKLFSMNEDFIKRNISPGGSADLLAVTIFLALVDGIAL